MDETGFAQFLSPQQGAPLVRSYLSYCRRVEQSLGVDLSRSNLSEAAVANIEAGLKRQENFAFKSVANCMTAVRRYAEFAGAPRGGKLQCQMWAGMASLRQPLALPAAE